MKTPEFKDKFLTKLAERSFITRARLDELVKRYGFTYIQANSLFVFRREHKHFGSDLLKAYETNPARAPIESELQYSCRANELIKLVTHNRRESRDT